MKEVIQTMDYRIKMMIFFFSALTIALIVGSIFLYQADKKDKQEIAASMYSVSGKVQGFRTVRSKNEFLSEWKYYVEIDGKEYLIDGITKDSLKKGQFVHLEGDKYGVNVMEKKE